MRKSIAVLVVLATLPGLSGCLRTRGEVREEEQRQVAQQQVIASQRAETVSRLSEYDEELRHLRGRVEVVENKLQSGSMDSEGARKMVGEQTGDLNRRVNILQEAVGKMDVQIQALSAELIAMKAEMAARSAQTAATQARSGAKNAYELGQEFFNQKDWKKAIFNYQKYRDENAKGKNFPDATYKIGVAFQELGMRDEARTFYDEVIQKFPNSAEAKKAKTRLKSLKK